MMSNAILYVGHGTRSKKGAEEAKGFLERVIAQVDAPIQEISFLELTEPYIPEGFERCVAKGATEITVIPIFLLTAGHIKEDIPEALEPSLAKYPEVRVQIASAFGVQERIVDAISELVRADVGSVDVADSVLLVGRGSSDPAIHEAFAEIKAGVGERLGVSRVEVCYLAATTPLFAEGMEEISLEAVGRVIVVPYLLFAGLLLSEVEREVRKRKRAGQDIVLIEPLSRHQVIQDIVVERASFSWGLEKGEVRVAAVNH
ncbi:cobalamin biosynthesis protein CbiX [Bacillus sp. LL01]|uniref:sirohydrochlorin chelatase n=1 Tax=Bacillus sp. LL01 TaxID=1665556 RepID=UPI00064D130A|nr:sirohydrochlorin chelatase [Bacillus sp. LL01]KMJ57285.1 cobalamin biosynthesis protein CbiX [Bacillus sp. LL01]